MDRAPSALLGAVPNGLSLPIAEIVGTLAYAATPRAREAVLANLRVIAPDRANGATARRVFVEQTRNYIEVFRVPRMSKAQLLASVDMFGWDHYLAAEARGKGLIVASAHLGPISVVGQILSAHGYRVVLPVETERGAFARALNRARRSMGLELVPTETPLAVFRALKDGKVFGILADRAVTGVGERVPFFGREALLPSAHIALGLRSGAPVIPAFSGRVRGRYTASFEPALDLVPTGDRQADLRDGVAKWAAALERYVRRAPEQWAVFERVWDG